METAYRFFRLFHASPRGYGTYRVDETAPPNEKGKLKGKADFVRAPVSLNIWREHLAGDVGIGLSPILDDGCCHWGAIDFDVYNIELPALARRVAMLRLPLVVTRSKSGGAHLYLFLRSPTPARLVRKKLLEWAMFLGAPMDVEIFPKQDRLPDDPNAFGSWINMPYHANGIQRYAHDSEGKFLQPDAFLELAHEIAVEPSALAGLDPVPPAQEILPPGAPQGPVQPLAEYDPADKYTDFRDGFPCLIPLLESGAQNTLKNPTIFALMIYAKLKYGDEAAPGVVREWHNKFWENKHNPRDLNGSIRSALKKTYLPTCNREPLARHCDRATCMLRPFGIAAATSAKGIGGSVQEFRELNLGEMTKVMIDPPKWVWTINNAKIEATSAQLRGQTEILNKLMDALSITVKPLKRDQWLDFISQHIDQAIEVEVPEDASTVSHIMHYVELYCSIGRGDTKGQKPAENLDELLSHRPVTKDGRTYFQAADVCASLKKNDLGVTPNDLWMVLVSAHVDVQHGEETVKGKPVKYWSIKAFQTQTEEYPVPVEDDLPPPF